MRQIPASPLTEAELQKLDGWLGAAAGPIAGVEALDGFLVALVIGPQLVLPSRFLQLLFGGEDDVLVFPSGAEAQDALSLLMRHWNDIAGTLGRGEFWIPLVVDDEQASPGHEWALGFLTGVDLSRESWLAFFRDEERAGPIVPIFMLAHEHDPDPELRPPPLTPEKREEVLAHVSAGITVMHRHFLALRSGASIAAPGISRNAPCPCGSGRSYKRCCGRSR